MSVSEIVGHAKHRLSSSAIEIADRPNSDNKTSLTFFLSFFFYKPVLFRCSEVKLVGLASVKEII
jgi:hypothetical protein